MAISFKGAHFPQEIRLMGVRWYVAYPLSDRHVAALMPERGVPVDYATMQRWVVQYSPLLEEALQRRSAANIAGPRTSERRPGTNKADDAMTQPGT